MIDAAIDDTDATLYIVLLDWSKAFDRIKHDALLKALFRFGVRGPMLDLIGAIYQDRTFTVEDCGFQSEPLSQACGIAQGCPLSPYLFIMLMSVILADARRMSGVHTEGNFIVTPEMGYADDTLLLGSSAATVQAHLDSVMAVGRTYGLELNLQKTVLMRVRGRQNIIGTDGLPLKSTSEAIYLGGRISVDNSESTELVRRLAEGRSSFNTLVSVWKHANIPMQRKLQIFEACVVSRVLYGLESVWLLKDQLRKLDTSYTWP